MANDISNYLELELLDHVFKVASYTAPTNLYVSLHSGDPGETGASELGATGSYARANATTAFGTPAATGALSNDAEISFPAATADWNGGSVISWAGVWDAATVGNFLWRCAIGTPKAVLNGQTAKIPIGDLDITLN